MVNKLQKPDYSIPKAYQPIALMECTGKLLKKIVAKCFNTEIQAFNLLPMPQFGSRPHHNAVDAVVCLVHRIQGTLATRHVGALLLFDISGFFDNVNPARACSVLHNKGFPPNVCEWMLFFLMGREASIKIESYVSPPFPILNRTPQGSPLSPILSALYMSSLLEMAKDWEHCDLSLYVDDGAIYGVSATTTAATKKVWRQFKEVLT